MLGRSLIIRSGGQSGVDRAVFDVTLERGLEYCGWVPTGRMDEEGVIPGRCHGLEENFLAMPEERTALHVRDADATLILSARSGGALTFPWSVARRLPKPFLHLDLLEGYRDEAPGRDKAWFEAERPRVLNVAGPRASGDSLVYGAARWAF